MNTRLILKQSSIISLSLWLNLFEEALCYFREETCTFRCGTIPSLMADNKEASDEPGVLEILA